MEVPYGWAPREVWAGAERFNVFPRAIEPVDPNLLLRPIGVRVENPEIGSFPTSQHFAIDWVTFRQEAVPLRTRIAQGGTFSPETEISADFVGSRAVGMKCYLPDLSDGAVRLGFDPDGRVTEMGRYDVAGNPLSATTGADNRLSHP